MNDCEERLATIVLLLALSPGTQAQIVEVELHDRKTARAQKEYLFEREGRWLLRGESLEEVRPNVGNEIVLEDGQSLTLFVADPAAPEDVPYERKDGRRSAREPERLIELSAGTLRSARRINAPLALDALAAEVRARRERSARLDRRRKACEPESKAWFDAHFLLLEEQRRLQVLLEHHGFEPAARGLDAAVERLRKSAARDARWTRGQEALGSITTRPTPTALEEAAAEISRGEERFRMHASQHLVLLHDQRIDERTARELLTFGEEVIEGFRREFVDPHGCPDRIPDRPFAEFWIGPDEDEKHARYYERYYRLSWGTEEEKARSLGYYFHFATRRSAPEFLNFCRNPERDLRGLMAHRLGHELALLHFDDHLATGADAALDPEWLEETLGLYLSLEYVGASTTQCFSQREDTKARSGLRRREPGERPADYYGQLAPFGRPLDQLLLRRTGELGPADMARGWHLLRFLVREDGERGHEVLHSACLLARERETFVASWREQLRWFYAVEEGDPLAVLERLALPAAPR